MLKFAQCMREHGVDMPDPSPSGGIRVNGEGLSEDQMEAAQAACQKWMDMAAPEDGGKALTEEEEQSFLDMAACMRERGYNFPDPEFDGGRVTQRVEKGDQRSARSRRPGLQKDGDAAPRPAWSRPAMMRAPPTSSRADVSRRTSLAVALAAVLTAGPLAGCSVPGANDPADAAEETPPRHRQRPAHRPVRDPDRDGQLVRRPAGPAGRTHRDVDVAARGRHRGRERRASTGSTPTRCSGSTARCQPGATSART